MTVHLVVGSLMDIMRSRCIPSIYHPKQQIWVDERIIYQHIGHQAVPEGQVNQLGAEGYIIGFEQDTEKSTSSLSGKELSYNMVVLLLNKDCLESGYIITAKTTQAGSFSNKCASRFWGPVGHKAQVGWCSILLCKMLCIKDHQQA